MLVPLFSKVWSKPCEVVGLLQIASNLSPSPEISNKAQQNDEQMDASERVVCFSGVRFSACVWFSWLMDSNHYCRLH